MQQGTKQRGLPTLMELVLSWGVHWPEQAVPNAGSAVDPPWWTGHGSSSGISMYDRLRVATDLEERLGDSSRSYICM